MKAVTVCGLGYIGLPTALLIAEAGYQVYGYDIDDTRIEKLLNHQPVIKEPHIIEKLSRVMLSKKFIPSVQLVSADIFIIAVPTPLMPDKKADLKAVWACVTEITKHIKPGNLVILESTVPVGTTDAIAFFIEKQTGFILGKKLFVAHCPERVLPGKIMHELIHNSRMIGGYDANSTAQASAFYQSFVMGDLYDTDTRTAEMVKLVENSYRDVQIAFAHEVARIAHQEGLNPYHIRDFANKHPRVNILKPTCGVGGHCISIDPWFLVETYQEKAPLIKHARELNDQRPQEIIHQINQVLDRYNNANPIVLILGLTYKPDVADLRESPALFIAQHLANREKVKLIACEPHAEESDIKKYLSCPLVSLAQGINQADIIICLVAHCVFQEVSNMAKKHHYIIDTCGLFHDSTEQDSSLKKKDARAVQYQL